jgi:hypothetical protein
MGLVSEIVTEKEATWTSLKLILIEYDFGNVEGDYQ